MPLTKAVAYCQIDDSLAAGEFVMEAVIKQLKGQRPDFLFLFATVRHDLPKVLQGIQGVGQNIPLCGCSGLGTITQLGCDEANFSVALMGLKSEGVSFHPFIVSRLSADSDAVGSQIGEKIKSLGLTPDDRQLLFLFPDSLTINPVSLYQGIKRSAGYHIDCVGGTAGNDFHSSQTYQFCNQEILSDSVAGVLISGAFRYRIGITHGSKPIGNFKTVTKAEANVLYEIDGQPALTVLESIIGAERLTDFGQAINLISLGQKYENDYAETLISRSILGLSEERRSIKVGVQMPVGSVFRMLRRDQSKVQQGTQEMATHVIDRLLSPETAAYFYFNSAGRGSYLFGQPEPDVNSLLNVIGKQKELIGFFTFGEIAPVSENNHFHNYAGILVGIE